MNLTNILYGYAAGWTSSSFLLLENAKESPLIHGALNQDERSWVTSLFAISGVIGTLFYYVTSDYFGCKYSLLSSAVPHAVSHKLIFSFFFHSFLFERNPFSGSMIENIFFFHFRLFSIFSPKKKPQISWILIRIGTEPWHLYVSRVLSGLGSGGGFAVVPIFVAEISEPQ